MEFVPILLRGKVSHLMSQVGRSALDVLDQALGVGLWHSISSRSLLQRGFLFTASFLSRNEASK